MVEFALVAPMLCLMIFGMIWSGFMFMEYLHYSNQVRTVARQIAVTDKSNRTDDLLTGYITELEEMYKKGYMPEMYEPKVTIEYKYTDAEAKEGDIMITVNFKMLDDVYQSLPNLLKNPAEVSYGVGFPPKEIKAIQYRMKLEPRGTSAT